MKGALATALLLMLGALAYSATSSPTTSAPTTNVEAPTPETPDADDARPAAEVVREASEPSAYAAPTAPEVPAAPVLSADAETAFALAPERPDTVEILAERRSGRELFVLAAIDHSRDDLPTPDAPSVDETSDDALDDEVSADELDDDALDDDELDDDALDDGALDPCEELEGQDDAYCDCVVRGAPSLDRGYHDALGGAVVRIELFRIHQDARTRQVQAHRVLTGPVLYEHVDGNAPELRVNDVDHDGRVEVTVLVSFAAPDCDTFQEDWGTLGVILDGTDLHPQAVFAREHVSSGGDSDVNSISDETVWRFAPSEATDDPSAGEPPVQLEVRRTERSSFMEAEDDGPRTAHASGRWICPYDVSADRWVCPNDATVLTAWVSTVSPLR